MVEIRIDISELKSEGATVIKELTEFLGEKTKVQVATTIDSLVLKGEEKTISKKFVRVLLKKFLHRTELKDYFRVISGQGSLIVKEKKIPEEE
jgi:hypothetical protein